MHGKETKQNKKLDLIWIIPEIIGELFICFGIPVILASQLSVVGIFSLDGITYIAIIFLLLTNIKLSGLDELSNIKWVKNARNRH